MRPPESTGKTKFWHTPAEAAAHLDEIRGAQGLDGLGRMTQGLVQPAAKLRTEAPGQRRAGLMQEITDVGKAQDAQAGERRGRQPQGRVNAEVFTTRARIATEGPGQWLWDQDGAAIVIHASPDDAFSPAKRAHPALL